MDHPLDRPLWNALTGRLKTFTVGGRDAVRIHPDVGVFLACADASDDSRAALNALSAAYPGSGLVERTDGPMAGVTPDGPIASISPCVQMSATGLTASRAPALSGVVALSDPDAAEMLALATLTRPGPFRTSTHRLGGFIGVRRDGALIAMAGTRLRVDGFTELSGVCVHPAHRGRGLAGTLSRIVVDRILATGEQAFLHAYVGHEATIRLYQGLGFTVRASMTYTVMAEPESVDERASINH